MKYKVRYTHNTIPTNDDYRWVICDAMIIGADKECEAYTFDTADDVTNNKNFARLCRGHDAMSFFKFPGSPPLGDLIDIIAREWIRGIDPFDTL